MKKNKKNFPGAIRIARYFQETGEDFVRIARLFGGDHVKQLIAVMKFNDWTAKDVQRWRETLVKYKAYQQTISARATTENSVITTKKKKTKRLKSG